MASRFSNREPRNSLFSGYDASQPQNKTNSPKPSGGYGYNPSRANNTVGAYPNGGAVGLNAGATAFRAATPNRKGQYSDAVLSELENQNEEHLEGMSARVKMLKDITSAIGDEIRDSTALAEKMNDSFEATRVRLRGTMNRMLRMAEKTGVSWKVWLMFFAAVIVLFWWVRVM